MSTSSDAVVKGRDRDWWARPRIVLPAVGAMMLLVALLTPEESVGRAGDSRLSTHLAGPMGARAFYETAARFGYVATQRDSLDQPAPANGTTIHAVLAPPGELSERDAHAYLEGVRAGDALLYVADRRTPLSDSLGIYLRPGGVLAIADADTTGCHGRDDLTPSLWFDGRVHLNAVRLRATVSPTEEFAPLESEASPSDAVVGHAAIGFPLGAGRVIGMTDPDLLRNDVLRRCHWGADAIAMRMLEWLRAGGARPRTSLVFDEYRQGYGHKPSMYALVGGFLVDNPAGRALLGVVAAGLVLLVAAAPRPLPPRDREMVERRDPLEQVDALALAYEQVSASRTATARLLRGMRARLGAISGRQRSDDDFLTAALEIVPDRADDVAAIRHALRDTIPSRDLPDVGAALRRLEASLTTTHA